MDLERHPVFLEIELGPDLVENSLSDIAERSVEVVKDEQFANHVFPFYDSSFESSWHAALPPEYVPRVTLKVYHVFGCSLLCVGNGRVGKFEAQGVPIV
jgi:hypothetical protein